MAKAAKTKKIVKDAETGRFAKKSDLTKKPKQTYLQTVPVKKKK
ncbi:hypothetical protein [Flavobacterium sp.]